MSYATVAGLPPAYGLYNAFIGLLPYPLLGTSAHLITGPTAVISWAVTYSDPILLEVCLKIQEQVNTVIATVFTFRVTGLLSSPSTTHIALAGDVDRGGERSATYLRGQRGGHLSHAHARRGQGLRLSAGLTSLSRRKLLKLGRLCSPCSLLLGTSPRCQLCVCARKDCYD